MTTFQNLGNFSVKKKSFFCLMFAAVIAMNCGLEPSEEQNPRLPGESCMSKKTKVNPIVKEARPTVQNQDFGSETLDTQIAQLPERYFEAPASTSVLILPQDPSLETFIKGLQRHIKKEAAITDSRGLSFFAPTLKIENGELVPMHSFWFQQRTCLHPKLRETPFKEKNIGFINQLLDTTPAAFTNKDPEVAFEAEQKSHRNILITKLVTPPKIADGEDPDMYISIGDFLANEKVTLEVQKAFFEKVADESLSLARRYSEALKAGYKIARYTCGLGEPHLHVRLEVFYQKAKYSHPLNSCNY